MRYFTHIEDEGRRTLFTVAINDTEWRAQDYQRLRQFETAVLSRLANIIVGYFFKHYGKELIEAIRSEVEDKIAKRVTEDILHRLGLSLEQPNETKV